MKGKKQLVVSSSQEWTLDRRALIGSKKRMHLKKPVVKRAIFFLFIIFGKNLSIHSWMDKWNMTCTLRRRSCQWYMLYDLWGHCGICHTHTHSKQQKQNSYTYQLSYTKKKFKKVGLEWQLPGARTVQGGSDKCKVSDCREMCAWGSRLMM